jgi:hypothetical protein
LAFIAFVLMIIGSTILLLDDRQFAEPWSTHLNTLPLTAFMVFIVLCGRQRDLDTLDLWQSTLP